MANLAVSVTLRTLLLIPWAPRVMKGGFHQHTMDFDRDCAVPTAGHGHPHYCSDGRQRAGQHSCSPAADRLAAHLGVKSSQRWPACMHGCIFFVLFG